MSGSCPPPGDCSFEKGLCTWTNTQKGDIFDWIIGGGSTPSILTGPSKDHTTGSGRLMATFKRFAFLKTPPKCGKSPKNFHLNGITSRRIFLVNSRVTLG